MFGHLSVTRILIAIILVNVAIAAALYFTGAQVSTALSGLLPGKFGASLGPDMTGNHLAAALVLFLDALIFHVFGFGALLRASRHALLIGPDRIERLLGHTAGLSREDVAATSFAVAEEQKSEIGVLRTGRSLVWIGGILLLLAFPAVCFTYAHADAGGTPLLANSGTAIANGALAAKDAGMFTVDQLAGAILLDIPAIYKWHATSVGPNDAHAGLKAFALLFHILVKLVVLASIFALWRGAQLRSYVLRMAGPEEKLSPHDGLPASGAHHDDHAADHHEHGNGHDEHADHGHDGAHGQDGHGHDDHSGHGDDHADHGHGAHDDHGHGDQTHDNHGHDDHAPAAHGHDDHGHGHH
ncbi:MAG TPA: hypothetical protein VIJ72_05280 [Rhizomicrobium sp.]